MKIRPARALTALVWGGWRRQLLGPYASGVERRRDGTVEVLGEP